MTDQAQALTAEERDLIHSDISAILRALGLGDHARPYSTHEVVQHDILPILAARNVGRADPAPVADVLAELGRESVREALHRWRHNGPCTAERRSYCTDWQQTGPMATALLRDLTAVLADREPAQTRAALPIQVERGVECFHGVERGCTSYRCGSNCSQRFDRMHPCPACLIAEIHDLRGATDRAREPVQTDTAKVLAELADDFFARATAITRDDPNAYARRVVWDRAAELVRKALAAQPAEAETTTQEES